MVQSVSRGGSSGSRSASTPGRWEPIHKRIAAPGIHERTGPPGIHERTGPPGIPGGSSHRWEGTDPPASGRRSGDGAGGTDTTAGTADGTDGTTTDPGTTDEETPITDIATSTAKTEGGTTAGGTTAGATTEALDLREANVTGVEFEPRGGDFRFSVTLYHDDDGEDGYANWWQVESLAGERLGRRKLLHAHGTREFTRSETVSIPEGTGTVVVRGHDRTHGYGGQAALVDLGTATVEFVRQGPDPDDMPRRP